MSKYKEIKGFKVQTLASDTVASALPGTTWSSGNNLNTAVLGNTGFGTQSAAASVGGTAGSITNHVEEYDGSSWTEVTAVPTGADSMGSCGPQTSGMVFGGQRPPNTTATYEYNGASWTAGGDLTTARRDLIGAGTQTAGLAAFGAVDPPFSAEAEQYNGASWTNIAEGNTARRSAGGSGTSTSALAYGGYVGPPGATNAVEQYNGSSWTEVSELNTARLGVGSGGSSGTEALAIGGEGVAVTEFWNGSSWTEVADLAVARGNKFGLPSGPTNAALQAGGNASGASTATEEFTVPGDFQKINVGQVYFNSGSNAFKVTGLSGSSGTWSSGGALPQVMNQGTGCGIGNTSGMAMTGSSPPSFTKTTTAFQYNGTNWTEVGELNVAKSNSSSAQNSPIATTLNYAGDGPGTYSKTNEAWDNVSWTVKAELNVAGNGATGFGVSSTSAGRAGGQSTATPPGGPHYTGTEIWDGTSWSEVNELLASRRYAGGVGTVTAALFIGGDTDSGSFPGGRYTARVESWNGTSWSEITDLNTGRAYAVGAGIQTSAIAFGGAPPRTGATEFWNGSSWTEISDMAVARQGGTGNGSSASALSVGGESPLSPAVTATVEEWDGVEVNKTITVS